MKLLIICVQHNNTRSMGKTIEPAVEKQHENRFLNGSEFAGKNSQELRDFKPGFVLHLAEQTN